MKIYKIRVTGDVLETAAATRRVNVDGLVLTFGREPVYVQADELPQQLASDPYLRIEAVESTPLGADVIDLKSERVQEPTSRRCRQPTACSPTTTPTSSRSASRSRQPPRRRQRRTRKRA